MALHTQLVRFFFALYLMEFLVNVIRGQGGSRLLRGKVKKDKQSGAENDESGIEKLSVCWGDFLHELISFPLS
ncbi:MAG: hypothetical protein KJN87_00385, partial [Desulfofustis sp.]|nr:hypothetical protein [Desulfofustis sp.]